MKLILRLKRALQTLFEPDNKPDNTIYQLDPDNFGSFLPVRPTVNAPLKMGEWGAPTNDEEAERMLSEGRDNLTSRNLISIYQCGRTTGATVLEAFKIALKAHVDAHEHAQQTHSKFTDRGAERTWWAGHEYVDANQIQK